MKPGESSLSAVERARIVLLSRRSTIKQAARKLGVSRVHLCNMLSGVRRATPKMTPKLAQYFGDDWDFVIGLRDFAVVRARVSQ